MAKVYLKLGAKASSYNDSISGVSLAPREVIEIENLLDHRYKNVNKALIDGHLNKVSADEFDDYQNFLNGLPMEKRKKKPIKKSMKEEDEVIKEDDDEIDEDLDEDTKTDGEKREFLKESPLVDENMKKTLTKLKGQKLDDLYQKIKGTKSVE